MNDNFLMQSLKGKKILLGICGGIAAYKSAYLVRELVALGAVIRVVMTKSALAFIQPLTFQALSGEKVYHELFDDTAEGAMAHIELARWADHLLIAPASANVIAKMAHGFADDLLSTLYLATQAPVLICPAMNRNMWSHPATQANTAVLKGRGVMFFGPEEGSQACGDLGLGRMAEPNAIVAALQLQDLHLLLKDKEVLITASATQEKIDPVRYLSNRSSGKMGYALAQAAQIAGARVTLISGPSVVSPPLDVACIMIQSAEEMLEMVTQHMRPGMIFIGAAAVADYSLSHPHSEKLKKQETDVLTLTLKKNPDILATVVASQKAAMVIGFAAETQDVLVHAEKKLLTKGLDMIIANQVGEGMGFDSDWNQITIMTKQSHHAFDLAPKIILAGEIVKIIANSLQEKISSRNIHEPIHTN